MTKTLWDRLWEFRNSEAFKNARQPKYIIVWEDPESLDEPVLILRPSPEFIASAMHGGVHPPIEAYLNDYAKMQRWMSKNAPESWHKFAWDLVGGASHPYAEPVGPMTEEQAMEYLLQKDVPQRIWENNSSNKPRFCICRHDMIPEIRTHRDAWRLAA